MPPVSAADLKAMLSSSKLPGNAMMWFQGLPGWVRVADHPELAGLSKTLSADDENDKIFGELVKTSWDYFRSHELAAHVDEVLVGAIITISLDNGFSLIDLSSDGSHHYLRFENMGDHSRVVFQLTHLTPGLVAAKVLGQRMSVVVGFGQRSSDFGRVWQAIKAEYKSGYIQNPEPGTMTIDGDVSSGYIYVQVDLYLELKNYVGDDYSINYPRLNRDLGACIHALRKYHRGRFGG